MMSTNVQYALLGAMEGKQLQSLKSISFKDIGVLSKEFYFTTQKAEGCVVDG